MGASGVLADFDLRPRAREAYTMLGYCFETTHMFKLMRWIIQLRILIIYIYFWVDGLIRSFW